MMRFQISNPNPHQSLVLHAMCDSYAGIDQKCDVKFEVKKEAEAKREIICHEEDKELDNMPTLFQQFMGDLGGNQSESEDEEEDNRPKKPASKPKAKSASRNLQTGDSPAAKEDGSSSEGGEDNASESESE